jgi:lipopolysaccharide transport system ATP-binding protein
MVVRLGFAVATALAPDILITDEVLAVGDESFQKKCIAWIERYLAHNGTLLMCSHSMYHIQKLCRRAVWLKDGRVERSGPAADVTQAYLAYHEEKSAGARQPLPRGAAAAAGIYAIASLTLDPEETIGQGDTLTVSGDVFTPDGRAPVVMIGIVRADGTPVYGVATDMDGVAPCRIAGDRFTFSLTLPDLALLPGKYFVRAHALDPEGVRLFDHVERPLIVSGESRELGLVRLSHHWS